MSFIDVKKLNKIKNKTITDNELNSQKRLQLEHEKYPIAINKVKTGYLNDFESKLSYYILPNIKKHLNQLAKNGKDTLRLSFKVFDVKYDVEELNKSLPKITFCIFNTDTHDSYFQESIPWLDFKPKPFSKAEWFEHYDNYLPVEDTVEIGTYLYTRLVKSLQSYDLILENDPINHILDDMVLLGLKKAYEYCITIRF